MSDTDTPINQFFRSHELLSANNDLPALVARFAEVFIAAGPSGTQCVRSADFARVLQKRKQLFDSLGCKSSALISVIETPLDPRYVLARTRWQMNFAHNNDTHNILVDSTFLLDTGSEEIKILLYLAHQDIMQILKDRGIQPA